MYLVKSEDHITYIMEHTVGPTDELQKELSLGATP